MKPCFVRSSVEKVKYLRGEFLTNLPVNLNHCTAIRKGKVNWYPDNDGLPSIKFQGCDIEWAYKDVETRDADYEKIADNFFINLEFVK